jgi:hypothetical protein
MINGRIVVELVVGGAAVEVLVVCVDGLVIAVVNKLIGLGVYILAL